MVYNSQNRKKLRVILFTLIAILTLSIGYAAITEIILRVNTIRGTASAVQENFKVYFKESEITTGTGTTSIDNSDNTLAFFNITGLSKKGDIAVATYIIKNDSNSVGAAISLSVTNSNPEYFKVTEEISDIQIQSGEETSSVVKVEMIKTPITNDETTSISILLKANPIDNSMPQ